MSIFARSPYIVEISEALQEGSKINLFLWNGLGSAPLDPQYILQKLIPASNNVKTYYNISPYIREYINFNVRQEPYNSFTTSQSTQWCNVKIQKFRLSSGFYYQVGSDINLKAFDGFGYYEEGTNPNLLYDILHDEGTFYYLYNGLNPNTFAENRAGFIMVRTGTGYKAKYTNLVTGATQTVILTNNAILDVPRVYYGVGSYYSAGNKLEILDNSNNVLWTAYFKPNKNCRYTPVLCDFVNKYGCWQRTWFYAASNDSLNVENTNYNLMRSSYFDSAIIEGQNKAFNTNGKKSIKVNTDWVDESYNELLRQLMLSERILINNYPATLKTQSTELFKNINQKTINYQLEFDFAYNVINNVI